MYAEIRQTEELKKRVKSILPQAGAGRAGTCRPDKGRPSNCQGGCYAQVPRGGSCRIAWNRWRNCVWQICRFSQGPGRFSFFITTDRKQDENNDGKCDVFKPLAVNLVRAQQGTEIKNIVKCGSRRVLRRFFQIGAGPGRVTG